MVLAPMPENAPLPGDRVANPAAVEHRDTTAHAADLSVSDLVTAAGRSIAKLWRECTNPKPITEAALQSIADDFIKDPIGSVGKWAPLFPLHAAEFIKKLADEGLNEPYQHVADRVNARREFMEAEDELALESAARLFGGGPSEPEPEANGKPGIEPVQLSELARKFLESPIDTVESIANGWAGISHRQIRAELLQLANAQQLNLPMFLEEAIQNSGLTQQTMDKLGDQYLYRFAVFIETGAVPNSWVKAVFDTIAKRSTGDAASTTGAHARQDNAARAPFRLDPRDGHSSPPHIRYYNTGRQPPTEETISDVTIFKTATYKRSP